MIIYVTGGEFLHRIVDLVLRALLHHPCGQKSGGESFGLIQAIKTSLVQDEVLVRHLRLSQNRAGDAVNHGLHRPEFGGRSHNDPICGEAEQSPVTLGGIRDNHAEVSGNVTDECHKGFSGIGLPAVRLEKQIDWIRAHIAEQLGHVGRIPRIDVGPLFVAVRKVDNEAPSHGLLDVTNKELPKIPIFCSTQKRGDCFGSSTALGNFSSLGFIARAFRMTLIFSLDEPAHSLKIGLWLPGLLDHMHVDRLSYWLGPEELFYIDCASGVRR